MVLRAVSPGSRKQCSPNEVYKFWKTWHLFGRMCRRQGLTKHDGMKYGPFVLNAADAFSPDKTWWQCMLDTAYISGFGLGMFTVDTTSFPAEHYCIMENAGHPDSRQAPKEISAQERIGKMLVCINGPKYVFMLENCSEKNHQTIRRQATTAEEDLAGVSVIFKY